MKIENNRVKFGSLTSIRFYLYFSTKYFICTLSVMWNLVVLFIGITLTTILIYDVETRPLQDIDAATILNMLSAHLNQNEKHYKHKHDPVLENTSSDDVTDNDDNSHYGSLKSSEIVDLIKHATQNKDDTDISSDNKESINKKNYSNHKIQAVEDLDDRINKLKLEGKVSVDENTIKQILLYMQNRENPKVKPIRKAVKNQNLVSNVVHSLLTKGDDKYDRTGVIDDYSKIYVIFDPLVLQESSNRHSLSDVISKISSLPSASSLKDRAEVRKDRRYKGFAVKKGLFSRRARRDSKDKYEVKDSMEDYKQKRARNDHGGGGRTAIPYIRHRGDIYERNN